VTSRSINILKEYRAYMWQIDRDGKFINKPEPGMDHAMDALRYAVRNIIPELIIPVTQFSGQDVLNQLMEDEYGYIQ
jgi:hypothetical protein